MKGQRDEEMARLEEGLKIFLTDLWHRAHPNPTPHDFLDLERLLDFSPGPSQPQPAPEQISRLSDGTASDDH